jgi:hypothetical protein
MVATSSSMFPPPAAEQHDRSRAPTGTHEKHVHSILVKLRLSETEDDHRRVLAVVAYLDAR